MTSSASSYSVENRPSFNSQNFDLSAFSPNMLRCAQSAARPIWWTSEQLLKLNMPLMPGEYGQHPDIQWEKIQRIFRASVVIPAFPIALGLGITSCIPRYLGIASSKDPFIFMKGEYTDNKCDLSTKNVRIMTLNTCFMPGGISLIYGGVANWKERIDKIVQKILDIKPDVVCLQEVHDEDAAYALYEQLKHNYADFYLNIGTQTVGLNSGLFVASKYKTYFPRFNSFKPIEGAQQYVNKGVFYFGISNGNRSLARLFNAHLQPSPDDANTTALERHTRREELCLILNKMELIFNNSLVNLPFILAGDMNIVQESEEFRSSALNKYFTQNTSHEMPKTCTPLFSQYAWTSDKGKRKNLPKNQCITLDYVVRLTKLPSFKKTKQASLLPSNDSIVSFVETVFDQDSPSSALSDHHAVVADLKLDASFV